VKCNEKEKKLKREKQFVLKHGGVVLTTN